MLVLYIYYRREKKDEEKNKTIQRLVNNQKVFINQFKDYNYNFIAKNEKLCYDKIEQDILNTLKNCKGGMK